MWAEASWADVCELWCWRTTASATGTSSGPWCLAAGEVELVERLLVDLEAELAGIHLDYQAKAAATQVGCLHVAGRRFGRFVPAAARIAPGTGRPRWP